MTIARSTHQLSRPVSPKPTQIEILRNLHDIGPLNWLACWPPPMLAPRAELAVSPTSLHGGNPHFDRSVRGRLMAVLAPLAVGWACVKETEQGWPITLAVA